MSEHAAPVAPLDPVSLETPALELAPPPAAAEPDPAAVRRRVKTGQRRLQRARKRHARGELTDEELRAILAPAASAAAPKEPAASAALARRPDPSPEAVAEWVPQMVALWGCVGNLLAQQDPGLALSESEVATLAKGTAPAAAKWVPAAAVTPEAQALVAIISVFGAKALAVYQRRHAPRLEGAA